MTSEKKYRTEIPNIIDDLGLDPHERALYVHYKRSCGGNDCEWIESIRVTGQRTKMSHTRAATARKGLVDRGLIVIVPKGNDGTTIKVIDIWELNTLYYQQKDRPNIDGWTIKQLGEWCQGVKNVYTPTEECKEYEHLNGPDEVGVNNVYTSVKNVYNKKEPIKKEQNTSSGEGKNKKSQDKSQPSQLQLESQAMFTALVNICQYDLDLITAEERGMLNQAGKKMREKYKPSDIDSFEKWWYANDWRGQQGQPPTLKQIRATWGQYLTHKNGKNGHQPPRASPKLYAPIDQDKLKKLQEESL